MKFNLSLYSEQGEWTGRGQQVQTEDDECVEVVQLIHPATFPPAPVGWSAVASVEKWKSNFITHWRPATARCIH